MYSVDCLTFTHHNATRQAEYGGAGYIDKSTWISEDDEYIQNSASAAGGAMYGVDFYDVRLYQAHIRYCIGYAGGALYMLDGKSISIEGSSFLLNRADTLGGALLLQSVGTAIILSCNFSKNVAYGDGGGMALVGSTADINKAQSTTSIVHVDVVHCIFTENMGNSTGGGIYSSGVDISLEYSTMDFNIATYGAGFSGIDTSANISHTNFLNNTAYVGGGGVS